MGILSFVWVRYHRHKEQTEQVVRDAEWVESVCKVENRMISSILYFLIFMTGVGLLFVHVASICDCQRPPAWWIGLYGWVPISFLALYVLVPVLIYRLCSELDVSEACRAAFCWCKRKNVQIYPEPPD
jgi:hypothetical protein